MGGNPLSTPLLSNQATNVKRLKQDDTSKRLADFLYPLRGWVLNHFVELLEALQSLDVQKPFDTAVSPLSSTIALVGCPCSLFD
jgi:hypothetical protein